MVVQLLPAMATSSNDPAAVSGSASVHSSSDQESLHPSVVSDLLDGELSADELNEIPSLPELESIVESYNYVDHNNAASSMLDESHPATQIALTASALDGALGNFEFLPSAMASQVPSEEQPATPVALVSTQEVPTVPSSSCNQESKDQANTTSETNKKRGASTQKAAGFTKKRRVSKAKAEKQVQGSPILSPKVGAVPPPALISPSSSLSGLSDRKQTVTPPLSPMPVLPAVTAANPKPLLPKPSATAPPPKSTPSPTTTTAAAAAAAAAAPPSSSSKASTRTTPPTPPAATTSTTTSSTPLVSPDTPPNITTEHIHMLTSENGPAECAKAVVTVTTGVDGRRVSKSHLTQEQRAQASRDRNREHARNTRLRKKAYVEELKRTLLALCAQRDTNALEEQRRKKLEEQHRNVRFSVLEEFLRLRGNNVTDMARWSAILVPGFTLRLPTINAQQQVDQKTLAGVLQVVEDSNAFSGFLQTLGNGAAGGSVTLQYTMNRSDLFMDGNNALVEWDATSTGAANGEELKFHGNIKAQFDPESNKILSASLMFDSGSVVGQRNSVASS